MLETVNQDENTVEAPETAAEPVKTFTQEEVNAIIQERLTREREKATNAADASKAKIAEAEAQRAELQKKIDELTRADSVRKIRENVAAEKGIPAHLLTGDDEETCAAQATAILAFANSKGYPVVKDSGETQSKPAATTTRDQFSDWFTNALNKH